jgi:hypothetical protein
MSTNEDGTTFSITDLDEEAARLLALFAGNAGHTIRKHMQLMLTAAVYEQYRELREARLEAAWMARCPECKAGGGPSGRRNYCRWDRRGLDPAVEVAHPERVECAIRGGYWDAGDEEFARALGIPQFEAHVIERAKAEARQAAGQDAEG